MRIEQEHAFNWAWKKAIDYYNQEMQKRYDANAHFDSPDFVPPLIYEATVETMLRERADYLNKHPSRSLAPINAQPTTEKTVKMPTERNSDTCAYHSWSFNTAEQTWQCVKCGKAVSRKEMALHDNPGLA